MMFAMLIHNNHVGKSEDTLSKEAARFVAQAPQTRFMARLMEQLRADGYNWWSAENRYKAYPIDWRMTDLKQRSIIRAAITSAFTGMPESATRDMQPDEQAWLMDKMIKSGGKTLFELEQCFPPELMAAYFDLNQIWFDFKRSFPWDDTTQAPKKLATKCLEWFLEEAVITPLQLREAINDKVWQVRISIDAHADVAKARREIERYNFEHPNDPPRLFNARDELAIITPEIICRSFTLKHLQPIFDLAESKMEFEDASRNKPRELEPARRSPRALLQARNVHTNQPVVVTKVESDPTIDVTWEADDNVVDAVIEERPKSVPPPLPDKARQVKPNGHHPEEKPVFRPFKH